MALTLKILPTDPYFGFILNKDSDLEIYEKIFKKGYKCLSQYNGSKQSMTVQCPFGHIWSGPPSKVTIPCNNCQTCWENRKLTPAEKVAEIIISKSGTQLTPYENSKLKIKVRCPNTHIFEITPNHITSGNWCNICSDNNVDETKNRFYSILESNGATALTPYINSITKIEILCKHGHEYSQVPSSTNMGHGCPHCVGNSVEQGEINFRKSVEAKEGKILSPYVNNHTKINILCKNGHIFTPLPGDVNKGQWCIKCANLCPEQAKERFYSSVTSQGGKVLGEYVTVHTKVKIQCQRDHIFNMMPGHISGGKWCPACRLHCPIEAKKKFENYVSSKKGTILGTYVNTYTKIAILCENNHEFKMKPNNVTSGKWCRSCGLRESKGERKVREFLTDRQIQYSSEVTFGWMPRKRYDFSFVHNNRNYLVEFDGMQHFFRIEFFCPDEETYNHRRQVDIDKTVSALNNGYFVIRIAYSDIDDVDKILDEHINDKNPRFRLIFSDMNEYDWLLEGVRGRVN